MQTGVSYARLDMTGTERFQRLRDQLGVTAFGLNLLVLQPGNRGRIHKHARQEEVYLVLEGTLSLSIEGVERDMAVGELARVAPEVRRQLINRGPGRCVLLGMGAAGEHVGRDGTAYVSWAATEGAPPQETPLPEDLPAEGLRKS
jgi:uncharacterized cupin superfamily protein